MPSPRLTPTLLLTLLLAPACDTAPSAAPPCVGDTCLTGLCAPPLLPAWPHVPQGLTLTPPPGAELATADAPDAWSTAPLPLATLGDAAVTARWDPPKPCGTPTFSFTYRVIPELPSASDTAASDHVIAHTDPRLSAWATAVHTITWGSDLDPAWQHPERALGPASGLVDDVVPLGNGGSIILTFAAPFHDRPGPDLAVFENAMSPDFLELASVAVSSDGLHWATFPTYSAQTAPVAPYGRVDAREILGLAGRTTAGFGTLFDLATLTSTPEVVAGVVDLTALTHVRVTDLIGDGTTHDAFGHPIFDPTPTYGPAGFDLDAVGLISESQPTR